MVTTPSGSCALTRGGRRSATSARCTASSATTTRRSGRANGTARTGCGRHQGKLLAERIIAHYAPAREHSRLEQPPSSLRSFLALSLFVSPGNRIVSSIRIQITVWTGLLVVFLTIVLVTYSIINSPTSRNRLSKGGGACHCRSAGASIAQKTRSSLLRLGPCQIRWKELRKSWYGCNEAGTSQCKCWRKY